MIDMTKKRNLYEQLSPLFFETRQIMRDNLRGERPDPNRWLRLETLRYIDERAPATMHDIARYLRIKAPSATSLVSNLEKAGWVKRLTTTDKRVVRIALSAKGEKMLREYREGSTEVMRRVFSRLPERDLTALTRILLRVADAHNA